MHRRPSAAGSPAPSSSSPTSLAADNSRPFAVWIGSAPGVSVSPGAGQFLRNAIDVLKSSSRVVDGARHARRRRQRARDASRAHRRTERSRSTRRGEPRARAARHPVALRRAAIRRSDGPRPGARRRDERRRATSWWRRPAPWPTRSPVWGRDAWIVAGRAIRHRWLPDFARRDESSRPRVVRSVARRRAHRAPRRRTRAGADAPSPESICRVRDGPTESKRRMDSERRSATRSTFRSHAGTYSSRSTAGASARSSSRLRPASRCSIVIPRESSRRACA